MVGSRTCILQKEDFRVAARRDTLRPCPLVVPQIKRVGIPRRAGAPHEERLVTMCIRMPAAASAFLLAIFALAPATMAAQQKNTYLLAMAACPPWKVIADDAKATAEMAASCKTDVTTMVAGLRKALAVPEANVTTRLNEEADGAGVVAAFSDIAARVKPEDRLVIYLNFHGGNIDATYDGYGVKDEIIATYTTSEPTDFAAATARGDWMPLKRLRDLVDTIPAEEIVVIFEVCEVGSGFKDFRYDLGRRYEKGWKGREAVIFSSRGDQAATYNEAGTVALFTEKFSGELSKAPSGNIRDLFERSALATHRSRRATCMKDDNLDTLFDDRAAYMDGCTQMPTVFDPYGLLDDIQIGGVTTPSRWDELKSHKPAPKKVASGKDNKAASSAKKTVVPDQAKAGAQDPDPFAWTRPFMGPQALGYGQPAVYPQ